MENYQKKDQQMVITLLAGIIFAGSFQDYNGTFGIDDEAAVNRAREIYETARRMPVIEDSEVE